MPASGVAETAWAACRDPKKLYCYVPKSIRWIDRLKGLSPEWCAADPQGTALLITTNTTVFTYARVTVSGGTVNTTP